LPVSFPVQIIYRIVSYRKCMDRHKTSAASTAPSEQAASRYRAPHATDTRAVQSVGEAWSVGGQSAASAVLTTYEPVSFAPSSRAGWPRPGQLGAVCPCTQAEVTRPAVPVRSSPAWPCLVLPLVTRSSCWEGQSSRERFVTTGRHGQFGANDAAIYTEVWIK